MYGREQMPPAMSMQLSEVLVRKLLYRPVPHGTQMPPRYCVRSVNMVGGHDFGGAKSHWSHTVGAAHDRLMDLFNLAAYMVGNKPAFCGFDRRRPGRDAVALHVQALPAADNVEKVVGWRWILSSNEPISPDVLVAMEVAAKKRAKPRAKAPAGGDKGAKKKTRKKKGRSVIDDEAEADEHDEEEEDEEELDSDASDRDDVPPESPGHLGWMSLEAARTPIRPLAGAPAASGGGGTKRRRDASEDYDDQLEAIERHHAKKAKKAAPPAPYALSLSPSPHLRRVEALPPVVEPAVAQQRANELAIKCMQTEADWVSMRRRALGDKIRKHLQTNLPDDYDYLYMAGTQELAAKYLFPYYRDAYETALQGDPRNYEALDRQPQPSDAAYLEALAAGFTAGDMFTVGLDGAARPLNLALAADPRHYYPDRIWPAEAAPDQANYAEQLRGAHADLFAPGAPAPTQYPEETPVFEVTAYYIFPELLLHRPMPFTLGATMKREIYAFEDGDFIHANFKDLFAQIAIHTNPARAAVDPRTLIGGTLTEADLTDMNITGRNAQQILAGHRYLNDAHTLLAAAPEPIESMIPRLIRLVKKRRDVMRAMLGSQREPFAKGEYPGWLTPVATERQANLERQRQDLRKLDVEIVNLDPGRDPDAPAPVCQLFFIVRPKLTRPHLAPHA